MRVIHLVLGKGNPNRANGVSRIVHNITLFQQRKGTAAELWGITHDLTAPTPAREYPLHLFQRHWKGLWLDSKLIEAIKAEDSSTIFHLHGGLCPDFRRLGTLFKRTGHRWGLTPHGNYSAPFFPPRALHKHLYARFFERRLLASAEFIQANHPSEIGIDLGAEAPPVICIGNGVNREEIQHPVVRESSARPVFGFCGRLDLPVKGLDILLEGFARYCRHGGKGRLWLIGEGPDEEECRRLLKTLEIEDRVQMFGALFAADKIQQLGNMDIFVQVSRHEGMSIGLIEAAALGLPLLISSATNIGEQVKHHRAGWVLEENTAKHLALAMADFEGRMATDSLAEVGEAASRMVDAEFSWEQTVEKLDREVYSACRGLG